MERDGLACHRLSPGAKSHSAERVGADDTLTSTAMSQLVTFSSSLWAMVFQPGTAECAPTLSLQREPCRQDKQRLQHDQPEQPCVRPVFVDPTGRRARLIGRCAVVAGVALVGYTAIFCVGLSGGTPFAPRTLVPGTTGTADISGAGGNPAPSRVGAPPPTARTAWNGAGMLRPEPR